jgi:hypothetical protein
MPSLADIFVGIFVNSRLQSLHRLILLPGLPLDVVGTT